MTPRPVLVSWSSGKDSAWALHVLRQQPDRFDVRGVFTTVTPHFDRVSIQATPRRVLQVQAQRLALPLYEIPIPYPCPNETYEAAMLKFLEEVRSLPPHQSADTFAFGDLFLQDIREYREANLKGTGFDAIFPVWGLPTDELAQTMLDSGLKAVVTARQPDIEPRPQLRRTMVRPVVPSTTSQSAPTRSEENGEFHTCVIDGANVRPTNPS